MALSTPEKVWDGWERIIRAEPAEQSPTSLCPRKLPVPSVCVVFEPCPWNIWAAEICFSGSTNIVFQFNFGKIHFFNCLKAIEESTCPQMHRPFNNAMVWATSVTFLLKDF